MFYFVLDKDNNPVREDDFLKWSNFILNEENTLIKKSTFDVGGEFVTVTTTFTGQSKDSKSFIDGFVTRIDGGLHHGIKLLTSNYPQALNDHEFFVRYAHNVVEPSYVAEASTFNMRMEERAAINEAKFEVGYKTWDDRKDRL